MIIKRVKNMDSKKVEYNNEHIIEREQAIENLSSNNKLTEEEFQNFMHRVTEIGRL